MSFIVGLGNPGKKYEKTRHNAGRIALEEFRRKNKLPAWLFDKKLNALKTQCSASAKASAGKKISKEKVILILPETYMNKSGLSLKKIITSKKKAENLIVIHDDIDLVLGKFKISFGRSSAGHKGVESIIKNIKTEKFIRIRVGISPAAAKGNRPAGGKKPKKEKLLNFLTGEFKPKELTVIKRLSKKISLALETIIAQGLQKSMSQFN